MGNKNNDNNNDIKSNNKNLPTYIKKAAYLLIYIYIYIAIPTDRNISTKVTEKKTIKV